MKQKNKLLTPLILIILELSVVFTLFVFPTSNVLAGVNSPNVTLITNVTVGNSYPEVQNVSIENDNIATSLIPNSTKTIQCTADIVDYNGEIDIDSVRAKFYDMSASSYGASDDNNNHYTNSSCSIDLAYGDTYTALANCTFQVEYYANPQTWSCNMTANDTSSGEGTGYDQINISQLLALGLPDTINYGTVNATYVSDENATNVTNYGNVALNISLEGYARTVGDGNAMNCSLGSIGNISIEYEKYNLTASNPGTLSLSEFEVNYTNLTTTPVIKEFSLGYRQNDTINKAINTTYWRIYVPMGVAGSCTGNIIFGATTATGS